MLKKWLPNLLLALLLSGCLTETGGPNLDLGRIPQKLLGAVIDPIKDFTVADARTTLAWIDQVEKAGQLPAAQAEEARACPQAVITMSEFVSAIEGQKSPGGAKGLIYLATLKKYSGGGDVARKMKGMALLVVFNCAHLVPDEALSGAIGGLK